jgi:phosphatidylinositol alpha-mannosyltransferase
MKIGFVLDDGLDKPDGVQQYILSLGTWLTSQGHEIHYLVGETKRTDLPNVHSLARNVKVIFNGNRLSVPMVASTRAIKKHVRQENYDILHVQMPYSPLMSAKVVRAAPESTAVVGTFHILPYDRMSQVGTRLLSQVLRRNLKRFDSIVSVSRPAAVFAQASMGIETPVIPNMVDISAFRQPTRRSHEGLRLLFLGRLVPRKGCQQLLASMAELHKSGRLPADSRLDICGNGPLRHDLEKFVLDNKLGDIVTFHGFVTQDEKVAFMQGADIAVFPSLAGESFGIVLIEAMAANGGVVLGGDNPGYRSVLETVQDSLLDVHNLSHMTDQLADFVNDAEKRAALFETQQKLVPQFDINVVGKQILDLYMTCKKARSEQ